MAETTSIQPQQTETIAKKNDRCTYCGEEAVGKTKDGLQLCGIPGNHPEYDHEELLPIISEIP